jgi:hypothetical protein
MALAMLALNLPRSGLVQQPVAADGAGAPPLNRGVSQKKCKIEISSTTHGKA